MRSAALNPGANGAAVVPRSERSLTICCYHAVTENPPSIPDFCYMHPSTFSEQIDYLQSHFQIESLSTAMKRLADEDNGRPLAAVTLDDGFQCQYDSAFPILKAAQCPATFFPLSGFIGSNDAPWFCRLLQALESTERESVDFLGASYDLCDTASRAYCSERLQQQFKSFSQDRLYIELTRLAEALRVKLDLPVDPLSPYRMLSLEALSDLASSELIEIGAHTVSHTILSLVSDERQVVEIEQSIRDLGKLAGFPITLFAYPNGRIHDYDSRAVDVLRGCGIEFAVTAVAGVNTPTTPAYELKRICIAPTLDINAFSAKVNGVT